MDAAIIADNGSKFFGQSC